MKRTELKEIKTLDVKELISRIGSAKKDLAGIVMEKNGQASAKGAKDVKQVSKKRRDVAQIWTILRQKQLLEELVNTSEVKFKVNSNADTSEVSEEKIKKTKGKDSGQARMTDKKKGKNK